MSKRYNVYWEQEYWLGVEVLARNVTKKQAEKIINEHKQYRHKEIWKKEV